MITLLVIVQRLFFNLFTNFPARKMKVENTQSELRHRIEVSDNHKYIIIYLEGEINRNTAMPYTIEAHKLGKKTGIQKYLLDASNARNTDTVGNNYDFAYKDLKEEPMIERSAMIALLVAPDDHSHDFIETLMINSGGNVRLFRSRDEALKFLNV